MFWDYQKYVKVITDFALRTCVTIVLALEDQMKFGHSYLPSLKCSPLKPSVPEADLDKLWLRICDLHEIFSEISVIFYLSFLLLV